ncbi:MMPL family transporter [Streptomyces sp. NPDC058295]|uniref:MMPL family transporter n=1 Tax=Streptomyces sp. NPDC058295 TaxID=3346431 RepID=UPI0036EF1FA3
MATFLYRLGRLAFRRRWSFTLVWVAALIGVGAAAAMAPAASESSSAMPGTESQQAADLINQNFPDGNSDGASAQIVFVAPSGQKVTAQQYRAAIDEAVDDVSSGSQVTSATDPFTTGGVSDDGSTAFTTVSYKVAADDLSDASTQALDTASQEAGGAGLTVDMRGSAVASEVATPATAEMIGIAIAALVLLVTLGSMAAAGLPLLTAIIGVGTTTAGIAALGSALGLSSSASGLASMLGLALGIDYALFVVSRYREERAKGHEAEEAVGRAVGTAGSAVVFAGLTVIIALAALWVVGIPILTQIGLCAAAAVLISILVALTLVPALLGFWPNVTLARRVRKNKRARGDSDTNGGSRWARLVMRKPLPVLILAAVGLGVAAVPVTSLDLGMPGDESQPTSTTERRAYEALADGFGPGFNGPLTLVVNADGAADPQAAVKTIEQNIGDVPGVVSVSQARFDEAGDTAVFSVVPSTAPTSEETKELVSTIRDQRADIDAGTGATFEVTGTTAADIDMADKVQSALIPYLGLVLGLAFLLLMVVFRSILVPLKAAGGFLLSVLAALGTVVAVFQWGWGASLLGIESTGPIMSMMPIFLVGIVFGLAMDYEVFLVSRMREAHVRGESPAQAVVSGFRHSGRVVVAAALIMIAVFSGFVTSGDSMIKMIGFGLAAAVLFDAFVVRMTIVPAVLALMGKHAWYLPKWLDRILPNIDVEGESLHKTEPPAEGEDAPTEREPARV